MGHGRNARKDVLDTNFDLNGLTLEDVHMAKGINAFLLHLCTGNAETRVQFVDEGNGFESWRASFRSKLARSSTSALHALMDPSLSTTDAPIHLRQWDRDALLVATRFGENVPKSPNDFSGTNCIVKWRR